MGETGRGCCPGLAPRDFLFTRASPKATVALPWSLRITSWSSRRAGVSCQQATVSVMELPHGLLKVGVELSHAAREEGVYHALREVAAQVCLEEGDQIGFVGLPEKETGAVG